MKTLKLLVCMAILFMAPTLYGQWNITPSTPATNYSQPNWKVDTDMNDQYMVVTYGNQNPSPAPGSTGTFLKIFDSNGIPLTSDIAVFNVGYVVSRVKISSNNFIYVLGVQNYGTVSKLVLKQFNSTGSLVGQNIVNHNIGGAMFDLEIANNNDVLVSLFEGNNLRIKSYNWVLTYKGNISVANNITHYHPPTSNLRSQFMDYNNGKILIGYSRGVDASLTSYIKKYNYNAANPAASTVSAIYPFTGGFSRRNLESNNSHQVALRSNGEVFYINGLSGIKRISGGTTSTIFGNTKTKVNVDNNDRLLISWTDNSRARALLYDAGNSFIHFYQEGGNMNGSWASAIYDCKFTLAGDKSNQGTDYHTNRKPHYQVFNCSDCLVGAPPTADFDFRFPNRIIQMPSLYGPQDVAELCLVDDLLVDGTDSCNEDGYFVEIAEFDLLGWNDILILHSAWVCTGCTVPNNIDIASFLPAGYQLRPNKVYRFRLAVGSPWHSVDKFFTIACCERVLGEEESDPHEVRPNFNIVPTPAPTQKEGLEVGISPNPAKDSITLDLSANKIQGETQIRIKDIMGKEYFSGKTEKQELQIDVSRWNPGVYLCTVFNNGKQTTKKIVKE